MWAYLSVLALLGVPVLAVIAIERARRPPVVKYLDWPAQGARSRTWHRLMLLRLRVGKHHSLAVTIERCRRTKRLLFFTLPLKVRQPFHVARCATRSCTRTLFDSLIVPARNTLATT